MNSLSFSSPFFVNYEPIKQNLNRIFANKYGKILSLLRNYELFDLSFSPFCKYLFIFSQIQNYSVYRYLDLTC
jgi:hypothetical protein